jgi:GNAT superfamily N-acetyltransferase
MSEPARAGEADPEIRIVELDDERSPLADDAFGLIREMFEAADRHGQDELRAELEERRRQLVPRNRPHVLVALDGDVVAGTIYGTFLALVNAGFVAYVAVAESHRGCGIARQLRAALARQFHTDAREVLEEELAWIVGEVRLASPWLEQLVRRRGAIPLDFDYYHPGMRPDGDHEPYRLYLEPMADQSRELGVLRVLRIAYAVYRHGYRVRYPLRLAGFRAILDQLEHRETVGPDPAVVRRALDGGDDG